MVKIFITKQKEYVNRTQIHPYPANINLQYIPSEADQSFQLVKGK